jgi:hypothetical protein
VPGKELFINTLDFFNTFNLPDQAEAGSAEEQPARNNPVADEVIRLQVWVFPNLFLHNYF